MRYEELTIEGRNAVLEAFRSGKTIDKVFVLEGCQDGPIKTILRGRQKKHGTMVKFVSKDRLDNMSRNKEASGGYRLCGGLRVRRGRWTFLASSEKTGEPPFIFLLDGIEDPHNLGAIIRTANLARGTRCHHSEKPCRWFDCYGSKDFRRSLKLYTGGESDKSGEATMKELKKTGAVVCMCRYGR